MINLFPRPKPAPIRIKFAVGINQTTVVMESSHPDIIGLLDGDSLEFVDKVPHKPGVYKAQLVISAYPSGVWDSPEVDVDYSLIKVIKLKTK